MRYITSYCVFFFLIMGHSFVLSMHNTTIANNPSVFFPYPIFGSNSVAIRGEAAHGIFPRRHNAGNRKERRAQQLSTKMSLNEQAKKISDKINYYHSSKSPSYFLPFSFGLNQQCEDAQKELLTLCTYIGNSVFTPIMIEKLMYINSYFNDCLKKAVDQKVEAYYNLNFDDDEVYILRNFNKSDLPKSIENNINDRFMSYLSGEGDDDGARNLWQIHSYNVTTLMPMIFDPSQLRVNGYFTEKSLIQFLAQAFREKKLKHADFSAADCLTAKSLGPQGGYNTLQLFLVYSACDNYIESKYIVKEARDGLNDAIQINEIKQLTELRELSGPDVKSGLPSLALPLAYFAYPYKNTIHNVSVMPVAKGKALSDLVLQFRDDQSTDNRIMLSKAFLTLGKELANFHKLFSTTVRGSILGETVVHGDFHLLHPFYDKSNDHFTFIDNTSIEQSIKQHQSPAVDIVKLFFMPFSDGNAYKQFKDLIDRIDLKVWHEIAVRNFVLGYSSTYALRERKTVLDEIRKIFNNPFTIEWVDFDDDQLQEIREKYINPIFDDLNKKYLQNLD